MTLKRLAIILAILIFLAGVGIMWLWQYAYTPEGRARVIIAQLKNDTTSLRGWMLQHHVVRPGFSEPYPLRTKSNYEIYRFNVSAAAAKEMGKLDRKVLPIVIGALQDDNRDVRLMAIWTCGEFADPIAIPPLLQCIRDAKQPVKTASGSASSDDDVIVQDACADSLVAIGPEAFGSILRLLENSHSSVRSSAACALGRIRDKRATDALIRHLGDSDSNVGSNAVWALGEIRDPKAILALLEALHNKEIANTVRISTAGVLERMGREEGLPFLLAMIMSPEPQDRVEAVNVLSAMWTKDYDMLLPLLGDSDAHVRERAAWALGQLRYPRAIPAVRKLLKDPDPEVRNSAAQALEKLEAKPPPASQAAKSGIPPLSGDVRSLREPPVVYPHGPVVDGLSLGLWSEKETYELNSRMNVWAILSNTRRDKAGGRIPYDPAIHKDDYLVITDADGREMKLKGEHPIDGPVGLGFEGGLSQELHDNIRRPGTYKLQWKIGAMESNVIEIRVVPAR
jgi:HEAT repeat protein